MTDPKMTKALAKGGRPLKYKPEYAKEAYRLCLVGLTDKELAGFFEVCEATLNTWKHTYPEFLESIKEGKATADGRLAEKLFVKAHGYSHPDEKIFCTDGQVIKVPTTKHYPPDTTALIFWLKNRQPKKWRDKQEVSFDGELKVGTITKENVKRVQNLFDQITEE